MSALLSLYGGHLDHLGHMNIDYTHARTRTRKVLEKDTSAGVQVSANRKRQSELVRGSLSKLPRRSNSNPDVALVIDFIGGYPFNHAVSSLRCP